MKIVKEPSAQGHTTGSAGRVSHAGTQVRPASRSVAVNCPSPVTVTRRPDRADTRQVRFVSRLQNSDYLPEALFTQDAKCVRNTNKIFLMGVFTQLRKVTAKQVHLQIHLRVLCERGLRHGKLKTNKLMDFLPSHLACKKARQKWNNVTLFWALPKWRKFSTWRV